MQKIRGVFFLLFLGSFIWVRGQDENANICDLTCVHNVYRYYCGDATCTTGASDYNQIFSLCTNTCASAIAGEVMMECLTTTDPERSDWENIQASVLTEIVDFCLGYDIEINPDVTPLTMQDTDKELLDTLFDDPDAEEEDKKKSRKKRKRSRKDKRKEQDEQDDQEGDAEQENQNSVSRRESRERTTEEDPEGTINQDEEISISSEATEPAASVEYSEAQQTVNGAADEAAGSAIAEEIEVDEYLEADINEVSIN